MPKLSHGMSNSPEFNIWHGMIQRCHNPNNSAWSTYGGRGITVCDEWRGRGGFEKFYAHIGPRPSMKHSLDRINGLLGYQNGNVHWATREEQQNNTSSNRVITFNGISQNLAQWSRALGLSSNAIVNRLTKGLPLDGTDISCGRKKVSYCYRGHPYNEENTYTSPKTGRRNCRMCKRIKDTARRNMNGRAA